MSAEVGLDKSGVTGDIPAYVPDDDGDTAFDVGKGPVRANFSAIGKEIGSGGTGGGASSACFVLSLSFSLSRGWTVLSVLPDTSWIVDSFEPVTA